MTNLRTLLTRMQSEATGCLAVLTVRLTDGIVLDACGDAIDGVALVLRELFAEDDALQMLAPGGGGAPHDCIVLANDRTYVCERLCESPDLALAAICRNDGNLGLVVGLLHAEAASGATR